MCGHLLFPFISKNTFEYFFVFYKILWYTYHVRGGFNMYSFQDQQELFNFVEPALKVRIKALGDNKIIRTEEELFEYLKEKKWKNKKDLHIYEIVHDILNEEIEERSVKI